MTFRTQSTEMLANTENNDAMNNNHEFLQQIMLKQITPSAIHLKEPAMIKLQEICNKMNSRRLIYGFEKALNEKQTEQVQKALKQDFTIIQGPPGNKLNSVINKLLY